MLDSVNLIDPLLNFLQKFALFNAFKFLQFLLFLLKLSVDMLGMVILLIFVVLTFLALFLIIISCVLIFVLVTKNIFLNQIFRGWLVDFIDVLHSLEFDELRKNI